MPRALAITWLAAALSGCAPQHRPAPVTASSAAAAPAGGHSGGARTAAQLLWIFRRDASAPAPAPTNQSGVLQRDEDLLGAAPTAAGEPHDTPAEPSRHQP